MYFLLIGGGAVLGYTYSDNIKDWFYKQNNYIYNLFKKKHSIIKLIKIEKLKYIEINIKKKIVEKNISLDLNDLEKSFNEMIEILIENNNISYLLIEYSISENDKIFRFNYPIKQNELKDTLTNFKDNFNLENNISITDENLTFLNNYHNENNILNIISVDYNNNDITEIIEKYSGINNDFHISKIDFRYLLDENYKLIYKNNNNLNIIKKNLDILQLNLLETNFLFVNYLY
jgi:hypothetical protein